MRRSSFRIDKDSVINSGEGNAVLLPNLEELLERETEQRNAEESEEGGEVQSQLDRLIATKQKQIRQIEQEIERLHREAEEILARAEAEGEALRQQAQKKGYKEAYQKAQEDVSQERMDEEATFRHFVEEIESGYRDNMARIEDGILQVALSVAEKILSISLERNDEAFLGIVRNTASMLSQENRKSMRVSTEDFARFFGEPESEIWQEMESAGVTVVSDPTLKRGDCIMISDYGSVNTGVRSQMQHIRKELEEG